MRPLRQSLDRGTLELPRLRQSVQQTLAPSPRDTVPAHVRVAASLSSRSDAAHGGCTPYGQSRPRSTAAALGLGRPARECATGAFDRRRRDRRAPVLDALVFADLNPAPGLRFPAKFAESGGQSSGERGVTKSLARGARHRKGGGDPLVSQVIGSESTLARPFEWLTRFRPFPDGSQSVLFSFVGSRPVSRCGSTPL